MDMTTDTRSHIDGDTILMPLRTTLRIGDIAEFKQQCDAQLAAGSHANVACDASAVEFIDAAALQYLAALAGVCSRQTRSFEIRTPSAAFTNAVMVSGYAVPLGLNAH